MAIHPNQNVAALMLELPQHCPNCKEVMEHTGDKLYYCRGCSTFALELDGTVQPYLLDPHAAHRDLEIVSAVPA